MVVQALAVVRVAAGAAAGSLVPLLVAERVGEVAERVALPHLFARKI